MSIIRKVKAVERIFNELEEEINNFKSVSNLHCLSGCGKCCTKPDIEASPLEFLPLAFEWFKAGVAHQKLEEVTNSEASVCMIFSPLSVGLPNHGSCSIYSKRGLICRLFGYAATRDKNNMLRLVTCKLIKEDQPAHFKEATELISNGTSVPVFSNYYKKLIQIDFRLSGQLMPINKAIKTALEEVLSYYSYRPYRIKKAG